MLPGMKINIIGGGPAGLYFAMLMKKACPEHEIHVYERGSRDATWGFGVVFSDDTMNGFLEYDAPSFKRIVESFAYWDSIETIVHGKHIISGGHGFCGMSRLKLLNIFHDRCDELGIQLHFDADIDNPEPLLHADLVVGADGLHSIVREKFKHKFGTSMDLRRNKFCWLGTSRPLDAFTFIFRKTRHGWFWVHAYKYAAAHSTWLVECNEETWKRAGLDQAGEAETVACMEEIFRDDLQGHKLISNHSLWRTFPVIRNAHWHHENIILIGDSAHTAHFSIGSGTKMAMEDAIALYQSFQQHPEVRDALPAYEAARREETGILQHTAEISLQWFENAERYLENMSAEQLNFSMLSRSKRITYDNLALRDPAYVAGVDRWFAQMTKDSTGLDIETAKPPVPIFQPFRIGDLTVPNRIALSPMCQYSAHDGLITEWHYVHYCGHSLGGVGLVFTEMICIAPEARITPGCAGLYTDAQTAAWQRITDFIHTNSKAICCAQIGHAGRKGATQLAWDGMDEPLQEGAWKIIAPSPLPYLEYSAIPRAANRTDMDKVCDDFARAVRNAARAEFDMIEIHLAHGYLLSSFISPLTNKRKDEYGGAIANRMRFPLECLQAARAVWPSDKPVSVRISACDWVEGGLSGEDMLAVARLLRDAGVDIINVSTGQVSKDQQPVYGRMFQAPFSDQIRNEVGIPTVVAGNITSLDQANTLVAAGRADIVALARPLLTNPNLVLEAAARYEYKAQHWPKQYLSAKSQAELLAEKNYTEMRELKIQAKPPMPVDALALAIGRGTIPARSQEPYPEFNNPRNN
jgi:anthraniloyl-CoA monooxygenase